MSELLPQITASRAYRSPKGQYRCPCGKRGKHRHNEPFPGSVEGYMEVAGSRYEIRRNRPGTRPTWYVAERTDCDG